MRHSFTFRLFTALLGVLVVFNLSQPDGLSGMNTSGMEMPGIEWPKTEVGASLASSTSAREQAPHCAEMLAAAPQNATLAHDKVDHHVVAPAQDTRQQRSVAPVHNTAAHHSVAPAHDSAEHHSSTPAPGEDDCRQHDCCTSALVAASLAPAAALTWLPESVISQETAQNEKEISDILLKQK
ncbi:MAG: hypothetical protein H7Z40_16865, partial [Phycisphaerae bacterium]|nr:hypothetical protein [Gemmatimonadaceae bacterium]